MLGKGVEQAESKEGVYTFLPDYWFLFSVCVCYIFSLLYTLMEAYLMASTATTTTTAKRTAE